MKSTAILRRATKSTESEANWPMAYFSGHWRTSHSAMWAALTKAFGFRLVNAYSKPISLALAREKSSCVILPVSTQCWRITCVQTRRTPCSPAAKRASRWSSVQSTRPGLGELTNQFSPSTQAVEGRASLLFAQNPQCCTSEHITERLLKEKMPCPVASYPMPLI